MTKNEGEPDVLVRERRSASRLKFEETGKTDEQVNSGIKNRVMDLLNGETGQEAVFSRSAAEVIKSISPG